MKITLGVSSDPFLGDPPDASEFYETIGRYVRVWSHVENHFNSTLLLMLNHPDVSANGLEIADGPVSFKQRIRLWRRLVTHVPHFRRIEKGALRFADYMSNANKDRNMVLHRAWQSFTSSDPMTVNASSWKWKQGELVVDEHSMSLPQIIEMTRMADSLNNRLVSITLWVVASYPPPQATHKP